MLFPNHIVVIIINEVENSVGKQDTQKIALATSVGLFKLSFLL